MAEFGSISIGSKHIIPLFRQEGKPQGKPYFVS